ncbi:MAG: 50S ribosomal protein L20 [Candidatus Peribacteria bacterium]|nr:MAG: 50S ribosomal protein L20 [Candidatus Peribacteria bacterium]
MVRVTNGLQRQRRHKKVRQLTKGYRLGRSTVYSQMKNAIIKQGEHAYNHRRTKKRDFRRLWIQRISAAVRAHGISYSQFINQMNQKDVVLDRKVLSNIAVAFPEVFDNMYAQITK